MPVNRAYKDRLVRPEMHWGRGRSSATGIAAYSALDGVTAALTGTFLTTPTEGEVVTGGQTIIITLTNGQWVASGATFNAIRQAIINGLNSDGDEAAGWNVEVRDEMAVTTVVRTSATIVTITLPAAGDYAIDDDETVTVTIPEGAIDLFRLPLVATPTIEIAAA